MMTACGNLLDEPEDNPKFNPIKKQFIKDAKSFGLNVNLDNIRISFGDVNKEMKYARLVTVSKVPENTAAYCQVLKSDKKVLAPFAKIALGNKYNSKSIIISKKFENASLDFLETIVYHELGHCALGYDHRSDSIMDNNNIIEYMGHSRFFYLKEFFTATPLENSYSYYLIDKSDPSYVPLHSVNYSAFNQTMSQTLYYSPVKNEYYILDTSIQNN